MPAPAVTLVVREVYTHRRTVAGTLIIGILIVAFLLNWAVSVGARVEADCGGPTVSTPPMARMIDAVEAPGRAYNDWKTADWSFPTPADMYRWWRQMLGAAGTLSRAFDRSMEGASAAPDVRAWKRQVAKNQQAALNGCALLDDDSPMCDDGDRADAGPPVDAIALRGDRDMPAFTREQKQIAGMVKQQAHRFGHRASRATVVALTAGFQESGVRNLNYGHLDSLGWLQQRPSQGWGTAAQVQDVAYATDAFFDALNRVPGWWELTPGQAAQKVQRSAYPGLYDDWPDDAVRLASQAPTYPAPRPPADACVEAEPAVYSSGTVAQLGNLRTPAQAVEWMTVMARTRTPIQPDMCLHYVAKAYGYTSTAPVNGRHWAVDVWHTMPDRYKHPGDRNPPRGALLIWNIPGRPGHIAISAGNGRVYSTDIPHDGVIGMKPFDYFNGYGTYLGWTDPYFTGRTGITA